MSTHARKWPTSQLYVLPSSPGDAPGPTPRARARRSASAPSMRRGGDGAAATAAAAAAAAERRRRDASFAVLELVVELLQELLLSAVR